MNQIYWGYTESIKDAKIKKSIIQQIKAIADVEKRLKKQRTAIK